MEIGKKLKAARAKAKLTQESVAEEIHVSRQTISNWENERSYPDILSVIMLSDLYEVSLDELLKGDKKMIRHLDKSTNIVKSNKKLLIAIGINVFFFIMLIIFNSPLSENRNLLFVTLSLALISSAALFYQIVRKL